MKILSLATTLLAIQAIQAQTLFTDLIVTDVDQGPGACIRMPLYIAGATSPVTDLSSDDMACGMIDWPILHWKQKKFEPLLIVYSVQWDLWCLACLPCRARWFSDIPIQGVP